MAYPEIPDYKKLVGRVVLYSQLKHEYGAQGIAPILADTQVALEAAVEALKALPDDPQLAALELAQYAHQVHLFAPELLPADQPLVNTLRRTPNVSIYEGTTVRQVRGERYVEGIVVETVDSATVDVPVKGVFVKLPRQANSELVRGWVDLDEESRIKVNLYGATSYPGVFAAGDVTHISEQVLVHIGEGAKAAVEAHSYLLAKWGGIG